MLANILKYKELLYFLVHKEIRVRYRNSLFGFLWSLLEPLGLMVIYTIVFSIILRFEVENYALFVLSGLIPWMFLTQSINRGTKSLTNNSSLIRKIYFPRQIFPITIILANLVNFIPALFLVLAFAVIMNVNLLWGNLLLLPFIILIHALFVLAIVLLLSISNVYYRDTEFVFNLISRAWMYLSPIIYPVYLVPEQYLNLYMLNPMAIIISMYRTALMGHEMVPMSYVLYLLLFISIFILFSWFIFNRLNRRVGEVI
ncbi:ABC-2 type transport system permease protein [Caldalkalibacillus uzonensis]|uniref:Transport permease protein n=1 Tax=Caldalkalibacillus uzonensis TaxID=353224 RepID=A0ABU0CR11_9BACI|nr:ABC transporter permease [Caldalkalibacillus uzonensis]MDQ0338508.1 ABC-2 type transport system permease protein [Caldalkalibacillus uzonensis]